uniref:Peptidase M24 domain-containing protein n=1 Tax=Ditylenchus dipsaci TaxID=166011 RepID=A0A915DVY9_9BILA
MSNKEKKQEKRDSSSSSSGSSSSNDSDGEPKNTSPSSDLVLTKYNMAAEIVNTVLKELIAEVKEGVEVGYLCTYGDKRIAMPTCVSVDNCVCHFSPLASEPKVLLKNGQLVKLDLGAHIDGYIATVAHTLVVGASKENKISGKKADVIMAAYNVMEMVLRMLKPEKNFKNNEITDHINQLTKIYATTPVENMLSHQMERFKINGTKQIIQNPSEEQKTKMEKCGFENFEVYAVDVLVSTGEGKVKTHDARTTVYKKTDDFVYSLKMKASRAFYHEAQLKFGLMPFSLRLFDDEVKAKMGVLECERHGLMQPYQVLYDREGEFVAQFKTTAIIMPSGIFKLTGLPLNTENLACDVKIEDEKILGLLKGQLKPKKKKLAGKKPENSENNKVEKPVV